MKTQNIIAVILFLFISNQAIAQWEQTFGPFGWTVKKLAAGNGYVYAGNLGWQIYRSSNDGLTWEAKSSGIWQPDIDHLFCSNGRVFAAASENGIGYLYVSDDNGESWLQHNATGNNSGIMGFTKIGSTIFFATFRNSVFKSTDNGDTWTQTTGFSPPYIDINCIESMGNYLFLGVYNGLYKSSDEGNSWQFCPNPSFTVAGVYDMAVKNNTLFLHYGWGYVEYYKSLDYGSTFINFGNNIPYNREFFVDGNYVYSATDDGLFRSSDDGFSWVRIALAGAFIQCITVSNGNLIIGSSEHGVFTSTNNGVTWINTGTRTDLYTEAIAALNNNTLLVGNDGQLGVSISKDNGFNFTGYNNLNLSYVNSFAKRGSDIFAGTTPYLPQRGGVFKSTDSGDSWIFIGLPNIDIQSVAIDGSFLYAGSFYDGVFRSSNDGAMWAQVNNGLNSTWVKTIIVHNNILYAGMLNGLYSSTNNGTNWNLTTLQGTQVHSLAIVDSKLFAGTDNGVYILEASGSWTQAGLANNTIYYLLAYGSYLIAGGYPDLSISSDLGTTWISKKGNIPDGGVLTLDYNNTYIFAGTALNGIWRRPLSEITGVPGDENIPTEFILNQNSPNPFNPSTIISYSIPQQSNVKLVVYDILGRVVKTLVDEVKDKGRYEINWDGTNSLNNKVSSGVYFYRLETDNFISTKKMLMMK